MKVSINAYIVLELNETSVVNGVHVIELELLTTQELLPSVDTSKNS